MVNQPFIQSVLTKSDSSQIKKHGLSENQVASQLKAFQKGTPYIKLTEPCTLNQGIKRLKETDIEELQQIFYKAQSKGRVSKFLPASGAATRMFRDLITLNHIHEQIDKRMLESNDTEKEKNLKSFYEFTTHLNQFAFVDDLKKVLRDNSESLETLLSRGEYKKILRGILDPDGLNYAHLPKALIYFHRYEQEVRTSLEEQIREAIEYTKDKEGVCRLHLTISRTHEKKIQKLLSKLRVKYEGHDIHLKINVSFQEGCTDTLAVDLEDVPFRDESEALVFRPGGHGSLINNLNKQQGDVVFVKNIDNVNHESQREVTYKYKRALGGLLVKLQNKVFEFVEQLSTPIERKEKEAIRSFCSEELNLQLPRDENSTEEVSKWLRLLNRPIRVCGMVPNQGEAGGGPFWTQDQDGKISLQIVESTQVDKENEEQMALFNSSTHFNPVDIVCGLRDKNGQLFDLTEYVDSETYFISVKSYMGRPLKAYEHPGLWNGGMANWMTVFVEVPLETFSPVKEVLDLLKVPHQPKRTPKKA